jgi:hypothetical protein
MLVDRGSGTTKPIDLITFWSFFKCIIYFPIFSSFWCNSVYFVANLQFCRKYGLYCTILVQLIRYLYFKTYATKGASD